MFICTAEAPENPAPDCATACMTHRRLGDAEAAAAKFLRHRDAKPAALGHRPVKLVRKAALGVALEPVGVIETPAKPRHRRADFLLLGRQRKRHLALPRRDHGCSESQSVSEIAGRWASKKTLGPEPAGCVTSRSSGTPVRAQS